MPLYPVPAVTPDGVEFGGFVHYRKRGKARVTTTPAISWSIFDEAGGAFTIAGSAADPTYIQMASFRIETALTGTNGDVLKLGVSATDTGGYIVNSAAVASSLLAVQAPRLAVSPSGFVAATADLTLGLFLHNGSNVASSNSLVAPAATPVVYIPVEIWFAKRATAPYADNIGTRLVDSKLDAGITW
jgi:hypothetical protein